MTLPLDRRHDPAVRLREVHAIRLAVIASVALLDSAIAAQTGRHDAATALQLAALAIAALTFVPGAFHRGPRGSAALSALMTTAAIGAAVLGRLTVAAGLACLFGLFEGRAAHQRAASAAAAPGGPQPRRPERDPDADVFPPAGRDERLVIGFVMVISAAVVVAAAAGRDLEGLRARVEVPLLVVVVVAAGAAVALHLRSLLRGPLIPAGRRR